MLEKIDDAIKYASDSNKIEEENLTPEESEIIREALISKKSNREVLEKVLAYLEDQKEENVHGNNRR